MPVNTSRFNNYLLILLLVPATLVPVSAQLPEINSGQLVWLGKQVFHNECNSQISCLTSWNIGEDFPSLGIGHFIWYTAEQTEIYTESFPDLLNFYRARKAPIPEWLNGLPGGDSPWRNREQFIAEIDLPHMIELREFLSSSIPIQVAFIAQRLQTTLPQLMADLDRSQQAEISTLFYQIAQSDTPYGLYALIDYVHFKGEGSSPSERYQGQGWGLLQVLETMLRNPQPEPLLNQFAKAAGAVLENRVRNAPAERNERRWLTGWHNRVATYIPPIPN